MRVRIAGGLLAGVVIAGVCGLGLAGNAGAIPPPAPILQVKKVVSGTSTVGFTVTVACIGALTNGSVGTAVDNGPNTSLTFTATGAPDQTTNSDWQQSAGVWQLQSPALIGATCTVTETPSPAGVTSVAYSCAYSEAAIDSQVSPQDGTPGCPGSASGPSSAPQVVTFPLCAASCIGISASALVTVTNTFPQLSAIAINANTVQVSGSNFPPSTPITVTIQSTPLVLGTPTTGADGSFSATFSLPCSIGSGAHTVTGAAPSGQSASASITLAACPLIVTPRFTG